MLNYQIAIQSHNRKEILIDRTLNVLQSHSIPSDRVTIFTSNEKMKGEYLNALQAIDSPYTNVIVAAEPMIEKRVFVRNYYPENSFIVSMDDDISAVLRRIDEKQVKEVDDLVNDVFQLMYDTMIEHENKLCGVYPINNPYFMSDAPKIGLYFIYSPLHSFINDRHPQKMNYIEQEKEDYERTLQNYVVDGSVSRLDHITIKSKYNENDGGGWVSDDERNKTDTQKLVEAYPDLCSMYIRKSNGRAELRLKDKSNGRYSKKSNSLDSFFS